MSLLSVRRTVLWLGLVVAVGCHGGEIEEPEHYHPANKPVDFPAAITRMQHVHREIVAGPLVAREVEIMDHHHDHSHDHDHDHDHGHSHEDEQGHVHMDALQEMNELVRWLPGLAADSELEEAPWNRVNAAANALEIILTEASSGNGEARRVTYLRNEAEIERQLGQLVEIRQQFPSSLNSLAGE